MVKTKEDRQFEAIKQEGQILECQRRSMVWKEFFKLKAIEIVALIGIIPILIWVPFWVGKIFVKYFNIDYCSNFDPCIPMGYWTLGIFLLLIIGVILGAWIYKNWEWANQRVNKRTYNI